MKKRSRARLWISFVLIAGMALFAAGLVGRWYLFVRPLPFKSDRVEFRVPPGSSVRSIAQAAQAAGIELNADAMVAAARFAGSTQSLRAGRYSVERGITLSGLLAKLQAGDVIRERLTVVEGIAFREMRALLSAQTELKQDSAHMSAEELLKAIGASETHPEGLFAPETYVYDPGISDLEIYRQAYRAQMKLLQEMGCPQSRSAVRQPVRGADHGVDHREGDWASVGASDDCRCVRQPVKTGYVAANRSFGHLRNGRRIRREPAQARSARRAPTTRIHELGCRQRRSRYRDVPRSKRRCARQTRRRCTSCRAAMALLTFRQRWPNTIVR